MELAGRYRALIHFNAIIPVGRARDNQEILLNREENEEVYEMLMKLRENREPFWSQISIKLLKMTLRGLISSARGDTLSVLGER